MTDERRGQDDSTRVQQETAIRRALDSLDESLKIRRWRLVAYTIVLVVGTGLGIILGTSFEPSPPDVKGPVLRAGFIKEFITRQDCYPGLREIYGLEFPFDPVVFNNWEIYGRLAAGEVDVIAGNSTSGSLFQYSNFVLLEDDLEVFPPYEAAPVVNLATLKKYPALEACLNSLGDRLSNKKIQELNYRAIERYEDIETIVQEFLLEQALIGSRSEPEIVDARGTITIASKQFVESEILAEMMATVIEHHPTLRLEVNRRFRLGPTERCFGALRNGEVDIYPEYTGTGLNHLKILYEERISDPNTAYERVSKEFRERFNLTWLERFGFNNTWTLIMLKETSEGFGVASISDLTALLREQDRALTLRLLEPPSRRLLRRRDPATLREQHVEHEDRRQPALATPVSPEAAVTALEGGRRWVQELAPLKRTLEGAAPDLDPFRKATLESRRKALETLVRTENSRIRAKDKVYALDKHRESMADGEESASPVEKLNALFTWVAMAQDALLELEQVLDLMERARSQHVTHRTFLGRQFEKAALYERPDEELAGLKRMIRRAGEERSFLTRQLNLAYEETRRTERMLSTAKQRLENYQKEVRARPEALSSPQLELSEGLPPESSLAELRKEVQRRTARANRLAEEAMLLKKEADEARRRAESLQGEVNAREWELNGLYKPELVLFTADFEETVGGREAAKILEGLRMGFNQNDIPLPPRVSLEFKEAENIWSIQAADASYYAVRRGPTLAVYGGPGGEAVKAVKVGQIDPREKSLVGLRSSLTELRKWQQVTALRARKKDIEAESVKRHADELAVHLKNEEERVRNSAIRSVVLAVLIGVITVTLAILVGRLVRNKELSSLKGITDPDKLKRIHTPYLVIRRIAVPTIYVLGFLLILLQFEVFRQLGITILASAGVVSLVAGFAARSLLGNAMAGVSLCFSQPLRVGDTVTIGGEFGTVEDVGLMQTVFTTFDNRRIIIPNESLASREIINHTIRDEKERVQVPIFLDYQADVEKARRILVEIAKASPNWDRKNEPAVWFMEMNEHTIKLWVVAWAENPDKSFALSCDILDNAIRRFREEGIPLPRQRFESVDGHAPGPRPEPAGPGPKGRRK